MNQDIEFHSCGNGYIGYYCWRETEVKLISECKYKIGVISQRDYMEIKENEATK